MSHRGLSPHQGGDTSSDREGLCGHLRWVTEGFLHGSEVVLLVTMRAQVDSGHLKWVPEGFLHGSEGVLLVTMMTQVDTSGGSQRAFSMVVRGYF